MDIARLRRKRQLNVQEQNALLAQRLRETACYWRENTVPPALEAYARSQGIDWSGTIILQLELDFPGMPALFGLLLTDRERFISFELDTDPQHQQVTAVECWQDVTDQQNMAENNPGIGKGYGAIALSVRRELC